MFKKAVVLLLATSTLAQETAEAPVEVTDAPLVEAPAEPEVVAQVEEPVAEPVADPVEEEVEAPVEEPLTNS